MFTLTLSRKKVKRRIHRPNGNFAICRGPAPRPCPVQEPMDWGEIVPVSEVGGGGGGAVGAGVVGGGGGGESIDPSGNILLS